MYYKRIILGLLICVAIFFAYLDYLSPMLRQADNQAKDEEKSFATVPVRMDSLEQLLSLSLERIEAVENEEELKGKDNFKQVPTIDYSIIEALIDEKVQQRIETKLSASLAKLQVSPSISNVANDTPKYVKAVSNKVRSDSSRWLTSSFSSSSKDSVFVDYQQQEQKLFKKNHSSFVAAVYGGQSVFDSSKILFRTLQTIDLNGVRLPRNTNFYAQILIDDKRLHVEVDSIGGVNGSYLYAMYGADSLRGVIHNRDGKRKESFFSKIVGSSSPVVEDGFEVVFKKVN